MSLDDDIAAWAATVRLPDAEAAAIFQRIVATPAPALPVMPRLRPVLVAALHRRFHRTDGRQHPPGTTGSLSPTGAGLC